MDLRLRPLRLDDEAAARVAHAELAADGFEFLLEFDSDDPWSAYLEAVARLRRGDDLAPDRVPATFLVAVVDGEIVGRTSIRHALNEFLARVGGHIGYGVRPGLRRRGYATEILRQSLIVARAAGVDRALVTCDDDNLASARAIERCGGALQDVVDGKRRYWID